MIRSVSRRLKANEGKMSKVKEQYLVKIFERDTGEATVHIRNIGPTDHASICGMDGGLTGNEHKVLPLKRGDKMNCGQCRTYYDNRQGLNLNKAWLDD